MLERVAKPTPAQGVTILQHFKPNLQKKNESGKGPSLGCAVMKLENELLKQRPKGW